LPGALVRNVGLQFVCQPVYLRVEETDTPFTGGLKKGQVLKIPIKHGEGCYYADPETFERLRKNRQILLRYVDAKGKATASANPNGSLENIAGLCNETRNVFGLMPHPEDACNKLLGSEDGAKIFSSIAAAVAAKATRHD
jgi:phosphoribosylformylglycinamidine synthase